MDERIVILDGSNEDALKRLDELIAKDGESKG